MGMERLGELGREVEGGLMSREGRAEVVGV